MSEEKGQAVAYVGFWIRFLAFVIDNIPVAILLALVAYVLGQGELDALSLWSMYVEGTLNFENVAPMLPRSSVDLLITAAFFVGCWMAFATTPGKVLFGAYIADAKTLNQASKIQLVVRYVSYYVNIIFTLMLGFLWIAFDKRKQGLHDKIAGTVVIKGKPLTSKQPQEQRTEQDS